MSLLRKCWKFVGPVLVLGLWSPIPCGAAETESVDFAKDIAPVIHEKCSNCHRKGQPGPFDLLSYQDVRNRATTIQAVLHDGYMPPWKPVSTQLRYANDRRLTTKEKQMFDAWVEAGMPAGDLDSIEKPDFSSEWSLGEPDLVVKMQGQFEVPASGPDVYRSFVFPIQLEKDQWVKAVELKPSAKGAVHHALFFIDSSGQARRLDGRDGKAGISGMSFLRGTTQSRSGNAGLGGYVPGAMPNKLPRDLAMLLPKGSDIVMQTHFHPTGKVEMESSTLGLYFADAPPTQQLNSLQLPPLFGRLANIDVPAGVNDYEIQDSMVLPVDVEVVQVSGHAHYICKEMDLRATLPDGKKMDLLTIDDWDLDWQDQYQFQEPVVLPAGTTLDVRILYDNSADNPKNPYSPPQRIKWGRESNDEMGSLILKLVAHDEKERPQLEEALESKIYDALRKVSRRPSRQVPRRPGVPAGGNLRELAQREGVVKRFDANGDGQLQWSEVPAVLRQRVFEAADLNGDRVIDKKELGKLKNPSDR